MNHDLDREFELFSSGEHPDDAAMWASAHGEEISLTWHDADGVEHTKTGILIADPRLIRPTPDGLEEIREHRNDR